MFFRKYSFLLKRTASWISLFSILVVMIRCAHQGMPSGGPEDETPPEIASRNPAHLSVNVDTASTLSLKWSEWMNRKSLENGFFMNPPHLGEPQFKWSGSGVKIQFDSSFLANTTYLISISSSVSDIHSVKIEQPILWAFSTGDSLNTGGINGRVTDPLTGGSGKNILVTAYHISDTADLRIWDTQPDYKVSVSEEGLFTFQYMNPGKYRLFAWADANTDREIQIGKERIAIPPYDCIASEDTDTGKQDIVLNLNYCDTAGPRILSVKATNPKLVSVFFSAPVPDSVFNLKKKFLFYTLSDSGSDTLKVLTAGKTNNPNEVLLITRTQAYSVRYRVDPELILYLTGDSAVAADDTLRFFSNSTEDTLPPRIISSFPKNNAKNILAGDSIDLAFSEPIHMLKLGRSIQLQDSSGDTVGFSYRSSGMTGMIINPVDQLEPEHNYKVLIYPGTLEDIHRNTNKDTLRVSFTTIPMKEMTRKISGTILSEDRNIPTLLFFDHLELKRTFRFFTDSAGFIIPSLPSGKYLFQAVKDANKNKRHDTGSLKPFSFAEQKTVFPDTLVFRARFENEITVQFER